MGSPAAVLGALVVEIPPEVDVDAIAGILGEPRMVLVIPVSKVVPLAPKAVIVSISIACPLEGGGGGV